MKGASIDAARAAKARALEVFGRLGGEVVGVGLTRVADGYGLKVNLRAPVTPGATLPESVEGVPVRVEVVGRIRPR